MCASLSLRLFLLLPTASASRVAEPACTPSAAPNRSCCHPSCSRVLVGASHLLFYSSQPSAPDVQRNGTSGERETQVLACCTSSFQPAEDKCVATVVWQLLVLQQRKDPLLNCEGAKRKRCITGPLPALLVLDCFEGFAKKCQFSFIFLWTPPLIPN